MLEHQSLSATPMKSKPVRVLFVCSQNRFRSPTAEEVFSSYPGVECVSAGVFASAEVPIDPEHIEWADIIFVMERAHKQKLATRFGKYLDGKRVVVLGIPDDYAYMAPELVALLERKVGPYLAPYAGRPS
jgi:predicted protein tyrosine phosphatase